MKGLIVNVYRYERYITELNCYESYSELTLIGNNIAEVFEVEDTRPAVTLKNRILSTGRNHVYAVPCDSEGRVNEKKWYMFGGNFIYGSDSRFPAQYPIPLHDRLER
jgi:hypothetical protein